MAGARYLANMVVGARAYKPTELERLYYPVRRPARGGSYYVGYRDPDDSVPPFYAFAGGEVTDELLALRTELVPVVRFGRGICALNLNPTTPHDHAVNELLWRTVRAGEYNAGPAGDALLQARVLALQIPGALAKVLDALTLEELRACVDEVSKAVDAGHVDDLASYRGPNSAARTARKLMKFCRATPWKVEVHCAYVRPDDLPLSSASASVAVGVGATVGLSRYRRAPSIALVHLKLFVDYARYRRLWVGHIGVTPADASRVMMHAITTGKQHTAWDTVEAALMAARRKPTKGNWLARIPRDVLWNNLTPRLLFAACSPHTADSRDSSNT